MHRLNNLVNKVVTGWPSTISIFFSISMLVTTAFVGANEDNVPIFRILILFAIMLTIGHILVQLIESQKTTIDLQKNELSAFYITKRHEHTNVLNLSARIDKSQMDTSGYTEMNLVLNSLDTTETNVDLIISAPEEIIIKFNGNTLESNFFNGTYRYTISNAFCSISPHCNIYESVLELQLPIAYRDTIFSLNFTIGFKNEEFNYLIAI